MDRPRGLKISFKFPRKKITITDWIFIFAVHIYIAGKKWRYETKVQNVKNFFFHRRSDNMIKALSSQRLTIYNFLKKKNPLDRFFHKCSSYLCTLSVYALCTILTILRTLWNSEQINGLLIKLFCFLSNFDETGWNCSTHG